MLNEEIVKFISTKYNYVSCEGFETTCKAVELLIEHPNDTIMETYVRTAKYFGKKYGAIIKSIFDYKEKRPETSKLKSKEFLYQIKYEYTYDSNRRKNNERNEKFADSGIY